MMNERVMCSGRNTSRRAELPLEHACRPRLGSAAQETPCAQQHRQRGAELALAARAQARDEEHEKLHRHVAERDIAHDVIVPDAADREPSVERNAQPARAMRAGARLLRGGVVLPKVGEGVRVRR